MKTVIRGGAGTLIAEDLLLLVTEDESGKLAVSDLQVDLAVGGAMLVD